MEKIYQEESKRVGGGDTGLFCGVIPETKTKTYNISYNVGKCHYVVSYHNGVSTHRDGSQFFAIRIFKNKKLLNSFVKELKSEGYI